MTQPQLTDAQRALAAAIGEGFAEALQPLTILLRGELQATRIASEELVAAVDRLAALIAAQAAGDIDPDDAPDIEMPIERFHNFDWSQISAQVLVEDEFGPAIVSYGGKAFKRRAPDNAYGAAIWFSRAVGKNDDGSNKYVRLITFKTLSDKVEPMGRKVERVVAAGAGSGAPAQAPAASQPKPPAASAPQPTVRQSPPPPSSLPAEQPELPTWCEWCGERPALPGVPCDTCRKLGATAENRPAGRRPTADEEFDSWPSGSAGKPPLEKKTQQVGPRVSGGANANPAGAPSASAPITGSAGAAAARPPASTPRGSRQATIGAGDVYSAWTKWANDFARRYPHYRVAKTDRTDFYHLQVSLYSLGESDDHKDSRFAYIRDLDLLNGAIAAMEQHAKAHHGEPGTHAN